MKEIFKKVTLKGFERYSVSNYGNVRNNISGNVLSKRKASNGYLRVNLRTGTVPYENLQLFTFIDLLQKLFFRLLRANHMLIILTETKKTMLLIILNGARHKRIVNTHIELRLIIEKNVKSTLSKHKIVVRRS